MLPEDIPEYSTRIVEEIECPFCKVGKLKVLYKPSMINFTNSRSASAGTKRKAYRTPEKQEILSEKCPNCGRSKKEIEKAISEGPRLSHDEVLKRLREAGLDPTKLK
jgi:rubredoxin